MDTPEENSVTQINKDKTLTARILSQSDYSAMMSGNQKGIPLKVPSIPIKVLSPNTTQASTIPGVIVAKPNQTTPGVIIPGGSIRPANATNFILKGKAIPLVLEKNKNPVQNCNDLVMTTTASVTAPPGLVTSASIPASAGATSKVPNILRGTSSPSKNTIDRQIVSHEATIELRKNHLGILSNHQKPNLTTTSNNGSTVTIQQTATAMVSKENLNSTINGSMKPSEIPAAVVIPKSVVLEPKIPDLLQPLKIEEFNNFPIEMPPTEPAPPAPTTTAADLSELNLHCEENELGAIIVKSTLEKKVESEESEESSDQSFDLMCRETLSSPINANTTGTTNNVEVKKEHVKKEEPKVRDDDILCCGGCGCYGMAGEFFSSEACCSSCHNRILQKNRDKEKKERELAVQKQRREQRKKEQKEAKIEIEKSQQKQPIIKQESYDEEDEDVEEEEELEKLAFDSPHPWLDVVKGFSWSRYLECTNSRSAPAKLFSEAFPIASNNFKVGQKLEAIDPEHPALICVATISQVQGHRFLIHFDRFSKAYDFWENANSPNLFPVGWCETHRQKLMPPPGYQMFTWRSYLEDTNGQAAPKENFLHFHKPPKSSELNGWKIGLKLEAVDRSNTSLICVATVTNVMDGRVLIHFDGWDLEYDYWVTPSSPYIHPKGWCAERRFVLNGPKGYRGDFSWERYLEETRSKAVSNWAFKTPKNEVTLFKKGMKLEVIDKWNPIFCRVATVVDIAFHQIKVHFDGWPLDSFDFWVEDDSPDLHPVSWCAKTDHPLMPPLTIEEVSYYMSKEGCPTPGCRGVGNAKGYEYPSHDRQIDCPYTPQNLNIDSMKPDRLRSLLLRPTGIMPAPVAKSRSISTDSETTLKDPWKEFTNELQISMKQEPIIKEPVIKEAIKEPVKEPIKEPIKEQQPLKIKVEIEDELPEPVGRGSRKKKKRKFFGDENVDMNGVKICKSFENTIRKDIFSPEDHGHAPSPPSENSNSALPDVIFEQNAAFLKPLTTLLSPEIVKNWTSKQVAGFVSSVPRLNCDLAVLEAKIIDEEIDGEAFLLMTQNDFVQMLGVKLGPAIKIYNALLLIRKQSNRNVS